VLRKVAEEDVKRWADLRIPRLPNWLRTPLVSAWGKGAVNAMERAHFAGAPLDITAKTGPDSVAQALGGTVLPTGSVRLPGKGQVSGLEGFSEGDWWVQDAAAALPVKVLNPQPGERVLDLCAAPGGKTMQLAAAGAEVTALDISERRMERVRENLARVGLQATCVVEDAFDHAAEPLRRHPARRALFGDRHDPAAPRSAPCQGRVGVRRADRLAGAPAGSRGGAFETRGRLLFCTCSLLPDEGECQVEEALERHSGLTVDRDALAVPGVDPAWITEEGGLRLRPDYWADLGGMDGFYIALCARPEAYRAKVGTGFAPPGYPR
jgi:16S rRNA (cytosine967-C5)-methyltransferase